MQKQKARAEKPWRALTIQWDAGVLLDFDIVARVDFDRIESDHHRR
jgi:hypothetical protein